LKTAEISNKQTDHVVIWFTTFFRQIIVWKMSFKFWAIKNAEISPTFVKIQALLVEL